MQQLRLAAGIRAAKQAAWAVGSIAAAGRRAAEHAIVMRGALEAVEMMNHRDDQMPSCADSEIGAEARTEGHLRISCCIPELS